MPTIKGSFTPKEKKVEATEDKRSKVEIILDAKRRELVDYIIEQVKAGELPPWQRPTHNAWHSYNLESGLPYRGGNQLILALESIKKGYEDPRWMTENQLKKMGYSIDKETAKPVVIECWTEKKIFVPKEVDENGEPVRDEKGEIQWKPLLDSNGNQVTKPYRYKYASVYNGSVIEGLEPYVKQQLPEEQRIKELDTILANSEAPIFYDSPNRNYYIGGNTDEIHLEPETHFKSRDHLYATALHEIGHSTGHSSRLNRDMTGQKGDPGYAQEELVAEFTAAMLNDKYNLPFSEKYQKENSASYIEGWASALAKDPAIMFYAASQASKAATYIENNMLLPHLEKENMQEQVATKAEVIQAQNAPEQVQGKATTQELQNKEASVAEKEVPTVEQETIPIDVPAVTDDLVKKMPVMENPNKAKQVEPEPEFFTPHYEEPVHVEPEIVKKANTPEALRTNASAEDVKKLEESIPYELTDKQAKVVELAAFKYYDGDGVDPYIESKIAQAKDHNHLVNLAAKHLEVKSSRNMFDTIKGLPEDRVVTCVDDTGKQQPMSETQLAVVKPLLDAYREYPSVDNQKALSEGIKTVSLSDRKLVFDPDKIINRSIQEHMAVKKCIGGAKGELKKSQSFKAAKAR